MAECQILPYRVQRKRLEELVEWSSKLPEDVTPSVKRRRKDLWFFDPFAMSVDGVKENISNKTPNRCTCHGVRRSRRLAKTNHDSCKCWKEKENRKEKDLTAGTMIPCDVKDTIEPLLETWGMELRPQKHRLTPLKKNLSVKKGTETPQAQHQAPLRTVSPTSVLCSKLADVELFEKRVPSKDLAHSPQQSPLKEIQDSVKTRRSGRLLSVKQMETEEEDSTQIVNAGVPQVAVDDTSNHTEDPLMRLDTAGSRLHDATHDSEDGDCSDDVLLCRDDELATLGSFLNHHVKGRRAGSLYISGPPGTGKSASVNYVVKNKLNTALKGSIVININCMSLRSPQAIYSVLVKETKEVKCGKKKGKASSVKVSHFQDHLRDVVCSSSKMILLILDEMDQLDCRGQEILYSIFEWPSLPNSKLVLIGIANALDLTDRILPRLQARPNCRPQLLHFPPYDKDQLVTILTNKVQSTVSSAVSFDEKAIQFCARKVSSVHGDLRKAVDICRRAAEIVEGKSDKGEMKVTIPLVARVVSEVYGSSINSCGEGLPLQQKMAVCSFLLLTQGRKKKEVELGKFHDAYVKVCQKRKLKYESQQEFVDLCSLLETRGILALKAAKERRLTKVSLSLQEGDVEHALQDKALLSSVLEGGL